MAAVSIQLMPRSIARFIAAIESLSSCGPQANDHPPPPIAHAPTPTRVMFMSVVPSCRTGSDVAMMRFLKRECAPAGLLISAADLRG